MKATLNEAKASDCRRDNDLGRVGGGGEEGVKGGYNVI